MTDVTRRPAMLLAASGCALLGLVALRALEAQWPPLALWAFVLLSLTLGFGHGALDAVLLLGQFAPRSKALAVSALYLLCVLLAGWALSWSVPWALLLLVLMSVWHFGELHSYALWARLCVGGASVMWPMLVAQGAMAQLVQGTLGSGFSTAWLAWHGGMSDALVIALDLGRAQCECARDGPIRTAVTRHRCGVTAARRGRASAPPSRTARRATGARCDRSRRPRALRGRRRLRRRDR